MLARDSSVGSSISTAKALGRSGISAGRVGFFNDLADHPLSSFTQPDMLGDFIR
jgi:hypothetical protein